MVLPAGEELEKTILRRGALKWTMDTHSVDSPFLLWTLHSSVE